MAAMMIFNNLFGFTGISVFARYLVTPVLVIWCGYLVVKGACYLVLAAAAQRKTASPSHALGFPRGECARPAGTGSIRRV
jgi:hypothetical protein